MLRDGALVVAVLIIIHMIFFMERSTTPKDANSTNEHANASSPLFLTPYIESGNIEEGRRLARVHFPEMPELESYTGFFTVDKAYDSNQFLWYFPAMTNIEKAPVILWLQGGPGRSSLFGLFDENGPIEVKNGTFHPRQYHWALEHHLVYIETPVGTGFSFTNDSRGYCTNQTQIGEQLYKTVVQFFQLFPDLQKNSFIVSGESYAGKYVSTLAHKIHKKNPSTKIKINLQGLSIGNGWCDPVHHISAITKHAYEIGHLDWHQALVAESYQKKIIDLVNQQKWTDAYNSRLDLIRYINESTSLIFRYNYLQTTDFTLMYSHADYEPLVNTTFIREALHVGNLEMHNDSVVRNFMAADHLQSVAPQISELLDHYKILFYNGQVDTAVTYQGTVAFLRNLTFSGSTNYENATRCKWLYGNDQAGFVKRAGNLIEVLVRNAGHMVPRDQPLWALNLITWFADGAAIDYKKSYSKSSDPMHTLELQKI